jgi:hypothetical protein
MNYKPYFTLWAVFYLVFGLNLLFIPSLFMSVFGCPLDAQGMLVARVLGSALVALGVIHFMLRNSKVPGPEIIALIIFSLLFNLVDVPIMVSGTVAGVMNALGWVPVVVNITIATSAGYLLYKSKRTAK